MDEKTIKLKAFKPDSIIKVEVSAGFYYNVRRLFFWYIQKDNEKSIKAIEKLKTQDPSDEFELHLLTLMSLVYQIEEQAEKQGFLEEKSLVVPKST